MEIKNISNVILSIRDRSGKLITIKPNEIVIFNGRPKSAFLKELVENEPQEAPSIVKEKTNKVKKGEYKYKK